MNNKRQNEIELVAQKLLSTLNCYPELPEQLTPVALAVNVHEVANQLKITLVPYDFGEDVSGLLIYDGDKPTIGYNLQNGRKRQRFTIAHELGHHILDHKSTLNQEKKGFVDTPDKYFPAFFRNQTSSTGEDIIEREANAFAAALLMPEKLINEVIEKIGNEKRYLAEEYNLIQVLADCFDVSTQAMTFRINRLYPSW